ncbi:hypothetical protein OV090_33975 [Nannocystis sp. RBIL2]|uniref:hypothetical protein n=1 Tax=Nannocystis sp. RBIL2 TaxID=2996788 RepID=UPI00226D9200|nr:hypothetical protein [Nannocystis sp. RBIL2]MCY1069799.1 hypothetical protein [Nannocystis sp. RBIL2]
MYGSAAAGIGDEGACVLAAHPLLAGLTGLDLGDDKIGDVGLRALAEARLGAPRESWLRGNPIDALGIAPLAGAPHLRRLERLHLSGGALPSEAIGPLVRAPWSSSLRRLVLGPGGAHERMEPAPRELSAVAPELQID